MSICYIIFWHDKQFYKRHFRNFWFTYKNKRWDSGLAFSAGLRFLVVFAPVSILGKGYHSLKVSTLSARIYNARYNANTHICSNVRNRLLSETDRIVVVARCDVASFTQLKIADIKLVLQCFRKRKEINKWARIPLVWAHGQGRWESGGAQGQFYRWGPPTIL